MNGKIRNAKLRDATAIAEISRGLGLFPHLTAETSVQTQSRVREHLKLCLSDSSHSIYVAELPGMGIVGYVAAHWLPYLMLQGPEGYVSELFVTAAGRSRGVGGALLDVVKRESRARGCFRLSLLNLRNRESYERGFYVKQGWQERPEAANFLYLFSDRDQ